MSIWRRILQGRIINLPLHPILVRFPVALFTTALVFDLLSFMAGGRPFAIASYYAIWAGVIGGLIAIFFGFVEYIYEIPAGSDVYWTATVHAVLNVVLVALFMVNLAVRFGKVITPVPALPLTLSIIGVGLVLISSTLGMFMVFRHGVRVMTMHNHPQQAKEWREQQDRVA